MQANPATVSNSVDNARAKFTDLQTRLHECSEVQRIIALGEMKKLLLADADAGGLSNNAYKWVADDLGTLVMEGAIFGLTNSYTPKAKYSPVIPDTAPTETKLEDLQAKMRELAQALYLPVFEDGRVTGVTIESHAMERNGVTQSYPQTVVSRLLSAGVKDIKVVPTSKRHDDDSLLNGIFPTSGGLAQMSDLATIALPTEQRREKVMNMAKPLSNLRSLEFDPAVPVNNNILRELDTWKNALGNLLLVRCSIVDWADPAHPHRINEQSLHKLLQYADNRFAHTVFDFSFDGSQWMKETLARHNDQARRLQAEELATGKITSGEGMRTNGETVRARFGMASQMTAVG